MYSFAQALSVLCYDNARDGVAIGTHIPGPLAEQPPTRGAFDSPAPGRRTDGRGMSGGTRRLTGEVGRWSAGHRWIAITAWIGAVVVLIVTGPRNWYLPRWPGWLPRARLTGQAGPAGVRRPVGEVLR